MLSPEKISELYPVGAIAMFGNCRVATVLRFTDQTVPLSKPKQTKRGRVKRLSQKSLNRLNYLVQTTTIEFKSLLTLTYLCPPVSGKRGKRDLKSAIQWLKRRCGNDLSYVWWTEFTRAGAIHFHVLLSCVPNDGDRTDFALYWVKTTDQGQGRYCHIRQRREMDVIESIVHSVSHRDCWEAIKKPDGAKRYCALYATKPHQKKVPVWFQDIGRFWGASRDVREAQGTSRIIQLNEDELREILLRAGHPAGEWDIIPRHLWNVSDEMFAGL